MNKIYGIKLDEQGRCIHYHTENDIVALMCAQCQCFYACYKCHDEMNDHQFKPMPIDSTKVLCGNCKHVLSYQQYQKGSCPFCKHAFNPRCKLHKEIYFRK
ncbi:CHY zinc finger protein [Philodulcilactobacillus myokoensis]|uniref:CHY zinc finger protein n=1 Tax=Philodulcilactobacillus myokoensis TaxID=2929573 RepID=UPI0035A22E76